MFKVLGHWFKQIFGSSQPDQPGIASLSRAESTSQMAEHFDSIDAASHLVPYDENLLERTRTQWQFGDWNSLAKLDRDTLQHHPDRAKLVLLAAAGRLQIGQDSEARQYIRLAQDWGCSKKHISQVLIAGVHNNIGRAAAIVNQKHRALQHFEKAITIGTPSADAKLFTQARNGEQLNQLRFIFPEGYQEAGFDHVSSKANHPLSNQDSKTEKINEKYANFQSESYWEERYKKGGTSGYGSYNKLAQFKAKVINKFIEDEAIKRVIEFGSGDGNQLSMFRITNYVGVDISPFIVDKCKVRFKCDPTKLFLTNEKYLENPLKGTLTLSLDVIFHLIEDDVFESYMTMLFDAAERFCIIYSCDEDWQEMDATHVRRRNFTKWVADNLKEWRLMQIKYNIYPHDGSRNPKNLSFSNFYFYERL